MGRTKRLIVALDKQNIENEKLLLKLQKAKQTTNPSFDFEINTTANLTAINRILTNINQNITLNTIVMTICFVGLGIVIALT